MNQIATNAFFDMYKRYAQSFNEVCFVYGLGVVFFYIIFGRMVDMGHVLVSEKHQTLNQIATNAPLICTNGKHSF